MRNCTAIAPQDIPKAHGCEHMVRVMIHALDQQLGHPLRSSHDTRRVDRFISGYQDKPLDAVTRRGFGHDLGPHHIVLDGFAWSKLHKRHVLVRRGMEHEPWPKTVHYGIDAFPIGHVADDWE